MIKKFKHIFIDSFWSISGLVLMNFVAQFFVYPLWNKMMGQEIYGNIIFYISLMNIFSITFGSACCYARITKSSEYDTENEDYISVLIYTTIAVAFIFTAIAVFYKKEMRAADAVLYIVLCCLTLWRSYADVEFRLNLNYIGYFTYFVVISAGYILGGSLLKVFGLWTVSLLPGELFGLLFVLKKGSVFKIKRRLTI
ncbi:MAG: hypothetical protein IJL89_10800, partial [Firmicutes bacterium]|nr:hypothetical protein [Bacillota bacterium]